MIGLDEQVAHGSNIDKGYHNAQYNLYHHMCDCPNEITHNNYSSRFLTNAVVGTSIIDSMAVPVTLEAPADYTEVVMADVPCATKDNSYTVKIDGKADQIILNVEVIVDNFNTVYDINDIKKLVELNGGSMDGDDDDKDTTGSTGSCKCDCCAKKDGKSDNTDPPSTPDTSDQDKDTEKKDDQSSEVTPPAEDKKDENTTEENPGTTETTPSDNA